MRDHRWAAAKVRESSQCCHRSRGVLIQKDGAGSVRSRELVSGNGRQKGLSIFPNRNRANEVTNTSVY